MKVSISVKGRFHAFFLANELQKAGLLDQLVTSYPVFKAKEYGIQKKNIVSLVANEVAERLARKLPIRFLTSNRANYLFQEFYDKRAAKKIREKNSIFVGWSSGCLHTFQRLQNHPIKKIVENGSTHVLFQKEVMQEEYALHGRSFQTNDPMIEKQLQEYAAADYISTPSSFTHQSFLTHGISSNKLIQVPYGVDITAFYPLPKKDKKFRLIICGNFGLRKGIQYLLRAFDELNLLNAELYIIGPVDDVVKPLMKKYTAPNIIWAGSFSENQLVHEYAKGSVFCLPSIEEGIALVILQAMACGLPVICTTHSGGGDIITEGQEGFVLPIRDIEALKEKIVFLYENEVLRKHMGEQAAKTIRDRFTWAHYGEKMILQYKKITS